MESRIAREDRYLCMALVTGGFFAIVAGVPIFTPGEATKRVNMAVYGQRPLGLPWQVCHVVVAALIAAPMPWGVSNFVLARRLMEREGFPTHELLVWPIIYLFARDKELRRLLRRVFAVAVLYLLLAAAWIVYAGVRGI